LWSKKAKSYNMAGVLAMDKLIGRILLEQFRVESFIASGGMGAVYRVWDLKRNTPLAMKVLHDDQAEDPVIFKRFQREARALQRLAHPNIVPFYGLFQEGQIVFILQQFVDGASLKENLRKRSGVIPFIEALTYVQAISAALGYAHAKNLVHCDIKPGNVLVDRGGTVYLTDFGIARNLESSTTTTLAYAGTPAYMAPEQVLGRKVTPATDVYALGALAFELLTGRRPFTGNEVSDPRAVSTNDRLRLAHLRADPPDPRTINPKIPAHMAQVLLKALAKKPLDRFQDAGEFWQALISAMSRSIPTRVLPPDLPLPPAAPHPVAFQQMESAGNAAAIQAESEMGARKPSIIIPALFGLLVFACFGIAAVLALGGGDRPFALTETDTPTPTETVTATLTITPSSTWTPPPSETPPEPPSITPTWTESPTPSETPTPTPSHTPEQARSEWLAFYADVGPSAFSSNDNIFLFNIYTSETERLLFTNFHERNPRWSRDGRYIMYKQVDSSGTYSDIFMLDTLGMQSTRLTQQEGKCSNWDGFLSPDNQRFVYSSNCGIPKLGNRGIFIMNTDLSGSRSQVSSDGEYNVSPEWSPDGRWIVFTQSIGDQNTIYMVSPEGGIPRPITAGVYASFTPDGEWLLFSLARELDSAIYKIRLNGSERSRIGETTGLNPVLSHDGLYIAFQKFDPPSIWIMNADGANPRMIYEGRRTGAPSWRP
jgi:serine/threonine-protein kinase